MVKQTGGRSLNLLGGAQRKGVKQLSPTNLNTVHKHRAPCEIQLKSGMNLSAQPCLLNREHS